MLTYDELRVIAGKQGTVRWTKSGLVENLHIKKGQIFARELLQSAMHPIRKFESYQCVELTPDEKAAAKLALRTGKFLPEQEAS
jgi:hypothetical protein